MWLTNGPYDTQTHTCSERHMASRAQCLKLQAPKSVLNLNLFPAKYYVSLRKLLNHSVLQIMGLTMAVICRIIVGIKETPLADNTVSCSYQDKVNPSWKQLSILTRDFGRHKL